MKSQKEQTLHVLLVKADEEARFVDMENSPEAMRQIVGGHTEAIMPFEDDVALVCNDEGKSIGLRLNRAIYADEERNEIMDIIAGDFFVAFAPDDEGYRSLPDNLAHKYYGLFRYPEAFICAGNSIHVARIEN